ncbi:MAG: MlaE family ABC transporter permease [Pseudomonadota bacterium]
MQTDSKDSQSPVRATPVLDLREDESGNPLLRIAGYWTLDHLPDPSRLEAPVRRALSGPASARTWHLAGAPADLDSAGALVLARLVAAIEAEGHRVVKMDLPEGQRRLVDLVSERLPAAAPGAPSKPGVLAGIGERTMQGLIEANAFLAFIGELVLRGGRLALLPWRIRWSEVVAEIEAAGYRALGIIGLLSFLVGMVMAYQGGATLANYGANVLIVDLVAIITLREMGPLLTAVIVAGRTGSSYTAQLGTMQITQEIDALRAIGVSPFDMLILPKVIALVVVMPLLTVFANLLGLLGGSVVAAYRFEVAFSVYLDRLPEVVDLTTLMLGLVKTPVFAIVIALVGCMQGMRVSGSALAVGRATTVSVVQAIFLVIVIDALFSVLFNLMGY